MRVAENSHFACSAISLRTHVRLGEQRLDPRPKYSRSTASTLAAIRFHAGTARDFDGAVDALFRRNAPEKCR
jgi:hypothetical protein